MKVALIDELLFAYDAGEITTAQFVARLEEAGVMFPETGMGTTPDGQVIQNQFRREILNRIEHRVRNLGEFSDSKTIKILNDLWELVRDTKVPLPPVPEKLKNMAYSATEVNESAAHDAWRAYAKKQFDALNAIWRLVGTDREFSHFRGDPNEIVEEVRKCSE